MTGAGAIGAGAPEGQGTPPSPRRAAATRALRYTLAPDGTGLFATRLDALSTDDLRRSRAAHPPMAYVVRNADLEAFAGATDLIVNRGTKDARKGLSPRLLGLDRVPIITGSFRAAGQLVRSLRVLLGHARGRKDGNTYVIGAGDRLFEALFRQAPPAPEVTGGLSARRAGSAAAQLLDLLPPTPEPASLATRFIGGSPEARLVRQLIVKATRHAESVLVLGDTGTGKEVVARAIHDYDVRRAREPFLPVNCGAISRELFESELFGYLPGAFTDARRTGKRGLWLIAGAGTLFLDEIGDLTPDHQVKILRVLQSGKVLPIGGGQEVPVSARVIAATNRDLFAMVESGEFRKDLYYRLRPYLIRTPALREYPEDVPAIAEAFWRDITRQESPPLPGPIVTALARYRWPGNAREMRAVLVSLHALFGTSVELEHLTAVFRLQGQMTADLPAALDAASDARVHRLECLAHLRRVDDAVRACKVALRALDRESPAADDLGRVRHALRNRLAELRVLSSQPLLFHTEATHATIHRLKGRLVFLTSLLAQDSLKARQFWKRELAGEIRAALAAVVREVERLLAHL